ncbi:MAG TPA: enoyl-CoA hydratase/isomerase family protein [Thermoanaerobaculia bacterium]|nr:enoyl-CoA hydratase/isomerase family protein [Thermoanaerobaculia bacterium]
MIERDVAGDIVILRFAHGKASALDVEFLDEISRTVSEAREAEGVVLTGTGSIFSAGVDLYRLTSGEPGYPARLIEALDRALTVLLEAPRPVVAALNGHAIAGGCVLACGCDYRLMAEGKGRIGIPELLVGVPFPPLALETVRSIMSPQMLQRLVLGGQTLSAEEALESGVIDELVPADALLERAVNIARRFGAVPRPAFAMTKRQLCEPYRERAERYRQQWSGEIGAVWEAEETHEHIRDYLRRTIGK